MQKKFIERRPPCPADYRESLLEGTQSTNTTIINSSQNWLREIRRSHACKLFKLEEPKQERENIQPKFQLLAPKRNESRVTIGDYLQILKQTRRTSVQLKQSHDQRDHKSRVRVPKGQGSRLRCLDSIPSQKRIGIGRYLPKQYATLAAHRIPECINTIVNLYQLFKQLGYSESKIYTLVKNSCRGKKDVQSIFLSPDKHGYSRCSDEIHTRIKKMALMGQQHHVDQLMSEINDFRRILEEEFMTKGDHKISELESSIRSKIQKFQEYAAMDQSDRNRLLARTQHKNIDRVMQSVYKAQQKLGTYQTISKVSRWFYHSLGKAEDRINYNLTKDVES